MSIIRFSRVISALVVWLTFNISSQGQTSLNVTNFGAVGDAVQFYANTVSNSVVVTTTKSFTTDYIGKAIEVMKVGTQTIGINSTGGSNGFQDLVATVTNIVGGTNLYLSKIPQNSLSNTFATIGTDNSVAFQTAIQKAVSSGTNVTVVVPNGTYLCLAHKYPNLACDAGIPIYGGGWHLVGQNMTNTVILGQGAWRLDNPAGATEVWRGFLMAIVPPITNDYPVSIENLTMNGGVEHGQVSYKSIYPNPVDGEGWDVSHDAVDIRGFSGKVFTHWTMTNVLFTKWRGEMLKSNNTDGNENGNVTITGCTFRDGNATALNIYPSLFITNCIFDNMFQVMEYYQHYYTNTCWFVNNLVTNIFNNAIAFNGADGNRPPFYICGNIFYATYNEQIITTPGQNIYVISNQFLAQGIYAGHCGGLLIGSAGYQSPNNSCNSNIVVSDNTFSNYSRIVEYGSGISASDPNHVEHLRVLNNYIHPSSVTAPVIGQNYGWASDVKFESNVVDTAIDYLGTGNRPAKFNLGNYGQYASVPTNNIYWAPIYDLTGQTNYISYGSGPRFQVIYKFYPGTVYCLRDLNASQIPTGAQIMILNSTIDNGYGNTIQVYPSQTLLGKPVLIQNGQIQNFYWNGSAWTTSSTKPAPPNALRILN